MTTYPATYPVALGLRTRRIWLDFNEAVLEGQFSRQEQIQQHGGGLSDRWVGVFTTTQLSPAHMAVGEAFLSSLRGRLGTFYAYDPDRRLPLGESVEGVSWAGDSTVYAGASTTYAGAGLAGDGVTVISGDTTSNSFNTLWEAPHATLKMNAGDYFQVGDGFYMVTSDVITGNTGYVIIEFEPALRLTPVTGDTIRVINPRMIARLDVPWKGADTGAAKSGNISFSFHEVIPNG